MTEEFDTWVRSILAEVAPQLSRGDLHEAEAMLTHGERDLLGVDLIYTLADLGLLTSERVRKIRYFIDTGQFVRFNKSAEYALSRLKTKIVQPST